MAGAGAEAQDQRVREERVRGGSASAWPSPHSSRFSHGLNAGSELSLWTLPPGDGVGAEAGDGDGDGDGYGDEAGAGAEAGDVLLTTAITSSPTSLSGKSERRPIACKNSPQL